MHDRFGWYGENDYEGDWRENQGIVRQGYGTMEEAIRLRKADEERERLEAEQDGMQTLSDETSEPTDGTLPGLRTGDGHGSAQYAAGDENTDAPRVGADGAADEETPAAR